MEQAIEGYYDGFDLSSPEPGDNRSPAYRHGFMNGRDDAECGAKIRRWPRRTAAEARAAWAIIEAQDGRSHYPH